VLFSSTKRRMYILYIFVQIGSPNLCPLTVDLKKRIYVSSNLGRKYQTIVSSRWLLKKLNYNILKNVEQKIWVFTICVFTSPKSSRIQNTERETKKAKCHVNCVICALVICDTIHVGFVFFRFSLYLLSLVLKIQGILNTHLVNTHNFFYFFRNL
jgi:hypothetical protein